MLNALYVFYLILLLLRPHEFVPALQNVPLLQLVLLVLLAFYAVGVGKKYLALPQFPLILWFVTAAVVSVGMAGWWGGSVLRLEYLLPILALFVVTTGVARELNALRWIMLSMIVCACIMVLHGRWQLETGIGWSGLPPLIGRITYAGIFSDPNDLGQLFAMCIPFCLYFFYDGGGVRKLVFGSAIAWLCYGIQMTDSRGTMLAVLAVFVVESRKRLSKALMVAGAVVAVPLMIAFTRFGQISASEESANDRIESWYAGLQMFLNSPLFGVGMGNYTEHHILTAHNSIVLPIAELGLAGFVPWFGIIWTTWLMMRWLAFRAHTPRSADATQGGVALIVEEDRATQTLLATAVAFAVSSFFLSQSYKHVLFITVALIVARFIKSREVFADDPKISLGREMPRIVILALAAIFGMWVCVRFLL